MSYSFDTNTTSKWDTIQEDVADMYLEDVEDDEEGDIFGFSKSVQIDHLSDEEVDTILDMFGEDY